MDSFLTFTENYYLLIVRENLKKNSNKIVGCLNIRRIRGDFNARRQ